MRAFGLFILYFIISCNSTTSNNCFFYNEGIKYFDKHYHVDYMDNGSRDTTISLLQKALEQGCEDFDLYYKLYFCYYWNGDFRNAEKYLSEAIRLNRNKNAELLYSRGELNLKLKRLKEAASDFSRYVGFSNALYLKDGFYRLGLTQFVVGDSIGAEINMKKAVELNGGKKLRDYNEFAAAWNLQN